MEQVSEQKLQELVGAIIGEYKMKGSISTPRFAKSWKRWI